MFGGLWTMADYGYYINKKVLLTVDKPNIGELNFTGVIIDVDNSVLTLHDKFGLRQIISLDQIKYISELSKGAKNG